MGACGGGGSAAEGRAGQRRGRGTLAVDLPRPLFPRQEPKLGAAAASSAALPVVRLGVCAMDKKAGSKPVAEIVRRLTAGGEFELVPFGDAVILASPIADWPLCDVLLAWHSDGFPLAKAQAYASLRRPYLINDLHLQDLLLDRRAVYATLATAGIPVPTHVVIDRDGLAAGADPDGFVETEDYVEVRGTRIHKPFVEKPANAEDHNIYIYYPHSMGGGVKKLFRKVHDKSGDYDAAHPGTVRRDGSYIVEEFLTTGGTDVKVYTVGPRYAHAEARKSPVVDGKVTRSADGKELRFPVLLSPQEKEVARHVSLAFGQKVCGFDLLRSERGKSYVCDVNGFSMVKNSHKYYDDAAGILRSLALSAVAPHRLVGPPPIPRAERGGGDSDSGASVLSADGPPLRHSPHGASCDDLSERGAFEELRAVLAVIRHGDRTPKQKMKLRVRQPSMLALLSRHLDAKGKQAKLKSPAELQELLDVTRGLLDGLEEGGVGAEAAPRPPSAAPVAAAPRDPAAAPPPRPDAADDDAPDPEETREKLRIVRTVLEQGGSFAGVNRKAQLKPTAWAPPDPAAPDAGPRPTEALLILKHGGVLTHAGRAQAEALGSVFRTAMYPRYGPAGGGLLRLHSTYRHDLKLYSSDEGRVQTSAAAFTRALLDLEGSSLTPILVSLVKKDASMLDAFGKGASDDIRAAKAALYDAMTADRGGGARSRASLGPAPSPPPSPGGGPGELASSLAAVRLADDKAATAGAPPPEVHPMPADPLALLGQLVDHLRALVDCLRQLVLAEPRAPSRRASAGGERAAADAAAATGRSIAGAPPPPPTAYSALLQSTRDWAPVPGQPCGGERLLLLYDRWRKLAKALYTEKKGGVFDISKIPDIYDSAKYDAIHNAGLVGRDLLLPVYATAKALADAVIPNEYGVDPSGKLAIGGKIAAALIGKLLCDLANVRDESLETAGFDDGSEPASPFETYADPAVPGGTTADARPVSRVASVAATGAGGEPAAEGSDDDDGAAMHRLCPQYAQDINSPLRHVRTRVYFTSESHVHSLVNVLRYCHLGAPGGDAPTPPPRGLLSPDAQRRLRDTPELDYMTHVVLRLYECKRVPVTSPDRFRLEVLFSPGAAADPFAGRRSDHVLPVAPRWHMEAHGGVTLEQAENLLEPFATGWKRPVPRDSRPPAGVPPPPAAAGRPPAPPPALGAPGFKFAAPK